MGRNLMRSFTCLFVVLTVGAGANADDYLIERDVIVNQCFSRKLSIEDGALVHPMVQAFKAPDHENSATTNQFKKTVRDLQNKLLECWIQAGRFEAINAENLKDKTRNLADLVSEAGWAATAFMEACRTAIKAEQNTPAECLRAVNLLAAGNIFEKVAKVLTTEGLSSVQEFRNRVSNLIEFESSPQPATHLPAPNGRLVR